MGVYIVWNETSWGRTFIFLIHDTSSNDDADITIIIYCKKAVRTILGLAIVAFGAVGLL